MAILKNMKGNEISFQGMKVRGTSWKPHGTLQQLLLGRGNNRYVITVEQVQERIE